MSTHRSDVLIIGSGSAGLALALKMASHGKVIVLAKEKMTDTNSSMAQGGIAAVMSEEDSFEAHIQDTLVAGAGLCRETVVYNYIHQAPDRIEDLINWGVHFDLRKKGGEETDQIDLTREGGHSFRRILHFEDQTGLEIHRTLLARVREHDNITLLERFNAIDLIVNKEVDPTDMTPVTCIGAYALDKNTGEVHTFVAKNTALATGGAGKVYLYTSNWSGATGDGIAMAYRVGARIANLEFMQFHPTCLFHPSSRNFLISEALRGEGGVLIDAKGEPFMHKYHKLASLAPRDVVARSIDKEMKRTGAECVYLDMTKLDAEFLKQRFPTIYAKCMELGIDMTKQPIPVVPAAHYLCGGVLTDENGRTDIPGLWAIGETACTGLHGANRLASNSLLECLTTAHNCSEQLKAQGDSIKLFPMEPKAWTHPEESNDDEMIVITHMWEEIRRLMWNYMGIVRSNKRLERAQHRLENILSELKGYYSNMKIHSDILELRNIAIVANLSVECALRREESRGIHYNIDFPEQQDPAHDTIVVRGLI
ncbi:L-aspartate oxidase [Bdellovibrio sp. ZAP7]|uniref:L-aspartate oxidase n=1 Tax=Bdellovibrio sp. ZAP7 TaxID=2231053 RepID=UPI001159E191|nr:L-aspartate oxidase [Bdellovibrio sp. ZAP7]QDK44281.1 L-aspartate oxidase [Bdellovibrio sp. ZAP7]